MLLKKITSLSLVALLTATTIGGATSVRATTTTKVDELSAESGGNTYNIYDSVFNIDEVNISVNGLVDAEVDQLTATVYLNGTKVKQSHNVTVGRVSGVAFCIPSVDIPAIFPKEAKGLQFAYSMAREPLAPWTSAFGYDLEVSVKDGAGMVKITKTSSVTPTPTPSPTASPSKETPATKVTVNGTEISGTNVAIKDNSAVCIAYNDVPKLFPVEAAGLYIVAINEYEQLEPWCKSFGYTLKVTGKKVVITSTESSTPSPTPSSTPITPIPVAQKVPLFVNDLNCGIQVSHGTVESIKFDSLADAKKAFPAESFKQMPETASAMYLANWVALNNMEISVGSCGVYCNSNAHTPMELVLEDSFLNSSDQAAYAVDGVTWVPIRLIAEAMGWEVGYADGMISVKSSTHTVLMTLNSTTFVVDGVFKEAPVAPRAENNRTLVGLRMLTEALGCSVEWVPCDGPDQVKIDPGVEASK